MEDKTHRGIRVPWRYLIATQDEATLQDWTRRLRFFRFCRAVPGGHAADGDSLRLALEDRTVPQRFVKDSQEMIGSGRPSMGAAPVHYSYGDGVIWLSLSGASGDPYAVTAADVENALEIEEKIEPMAAYVIDPPLDSPFCVSPKFWPEFWK